MPTFGISSTDGTLSPCRAKPENRGRGSCPHGEHVELEGEMASDAVVQAYNEEKLNELYGLAAMASVRPAGSVPPAYPGGPGLSATDFTEATERLSDAFSQEAWDVIRSFTSHMSNLIEQEEQLDRTSEEVRSSLAEFLDSEDDIAVKVRAYLGPDMKSADFAAIMVHQVKGMTARIPLRNKSKGDSLSRIVLTSVANDMTRKRYVASVLFFAGKCCYCSTSLSKTPGPQQATGEHLTPLSPDREGDPVGTTRYGNMALACKACNDSRENKPLKEWVRETQTIPEGQKSLVLSRIEAFRRFALYEEYSPEQSLMLKRAVEALKEERRTLPRTRGEHPQEVFDAFRERTNATIFELQAKLES